MSPLSSLNSTIELEISRAEATAGGERNITYKRSKQTKKLMVKTPPGVRVGTKISLKGMGEIEEKKFGDFYLHIKVKHQIWLSAFERYTILAVILASSQEYS